MNTACNPHGILCSGRHGHFGNEKAGTRGQQVVDVTEAIKNGGIHPLCPRAGAGAARFLVVAAGNTSAGEPLISLWEPSVSKFVSTPDPVGSVNDVHDPNRCEEYNEANQEWGFDSDCCSKVEKSRCKDGYSMVWTGE